ncbi:hypothetical protein J7400_06735 [Shimia sp. R9_2]|uniref:KAP family P-loop NTPase fold protein n=1 Tax=Shimia sp. R9_2 TaxID=2821112 RepID=UPI001ADC2F31|nr:P-loop NTPase fold protein [Shimia sp. R9_2]MBO9396366.1 hypothetical protein [Shimia sp. R9_2]
MARLYIPEPKIKLYEDGFEEHDKLGRKATGDKLSDLVERIDDPLVIALDGAWGSGKSVFLKCWVGQHLKREGNTTQTVYFDAFQHDYLDDPLIALTSAISERIERDPESKSAKAWRIAKNAAPFLGKAALRLGTAALVGKAISLTGDEDGALNDIGDKLSEEGGDIAKSLDDFWKKEDGKRAAMEAFRSALVQLTAPDEQGSPTQKLVIVIDELDRCRPDYALSVLEIIKHFFNVDGVHFVLGTNLLELANSVRSRYGSGSNAEGYLGKFITLSMRLNNANKHVGLKPLLQFSKNAKEEMGLAGNPLAEALDVYLELPRLNQSLSLRDIERLYSHCSVLHPFDTAWGGALSNWMLAGLIILKHQSSKEFRALCLGNTRQIGLLETLGFDKLSFPNRDPHRVERHQLLSEFWNYIFNDGFRADQEWVNERHKQFMPDDLNRGSMHSVVLETARNKLGEVEVVPFGDD